MEGEAERRREVKQTENETGENCWGLIKRERQAAFSEATSNK